MSLIVVIGLVLGISGTAYASIMSLRGAWEATVKRRVNAAGSICDDLRSSNDLDILKPYAKHSNKFQRGKWYWEFSQWIPTALLGMISLLMTIDVVYLDWRLEEKLLFDSRPAYWPTIYKAGLILLIIADVVAVLIMRAGYNLIGDAFEDLKALNRIWEKQRFLSELVGREAIAIKSIGQTAPVTGITGDSAGKDE